MKEGKKINSLWITVLLSLVIVVFTAGMLRITAYAAGPFEADYADSSFYFFKGNFSLLLNDEQYSCVDFSFSDSENAVTFLFKSSAGVGYHCYNLNSSSMLLTRTYHSVDGGVSISEQTINIPFGGTSLLFDLEDFENIDKIPYVSELSYYYDLCDEFCTTEEFADYKELPDLSNIDLTGYYSSDIPTPIISVNLEDYTFGFDNASSDYYFEVEGRWYTVDDIELYKEDLMWKYRYSTIIKTGLSPWVTPADLLHAVDGYDFAELGNNTFNNLLQNYPIEARNYYGGTNSLGNYFSGYNDALEQLQFKLSFPESMYNGLEVYVRYFVIDDDNNVKYGKWCHWFDAMAEASGSSGTQLDDYENADKISQSQDGLTTDEKNDLEITDNSKSDNDAIIDYIENLDNDLASNHIWSIMENLIESMGVFPFLLSTVFGWFPKWLINMIGVSLGMLIVLRFIGR